MRGKASTLISVRLLDAASGTTDRWTDDNNEYKSFFFNFFIFSSTLHSVGQQLETGHVTAADLDLEGRLEVKLEDLEVTHPPLPLQLVQQVQSSFLCENLTFK